MPISRQDLWKVFAEVLAEILEEKGLSADDIVPTATLDELGVSSIDAMHMMIGIEERLDVSLNFNKLVDAGGKFVHDITVSEVLEQVYAMTRAGDSQDAGPVNRSQTA